VGVASSTLLDRSWSTLTNTIEPIGPDLVKTTTQQTVEGAMNDLRFAGAWTNRQGIRVGGALHAITGRNVVSLGRTFEDSTTFEPFEARRTLSFRGLAASIGAELTLQRKATVGVSYRKGAKLTVSDEDSTHSRADVPDRFGISVAFLGIPGTTLAARASHDAWSSLAPLGTGAVQPNDSWDTSIGAEVTGPRFGSRALMLRAGIRARTLPFEAAGAAVKENSLAFGTGTTMGGGRVGLDIAGIYARRDAGTSTKERAWTLSVGLTARP
jgi:hypothetical protein